MKTKDKKNKKKYYKSKKKGEKLFTLLLAVLLLCAVTRSIPDYSVAEIKCKSSVGKIAVALTFDDGPGEYTEQLLDGLKETGAKATFFVLGSNAEKYPDTLKRIESEGHLIGNHSYNHINMLTSSPANIKENIKKSADIIESITGERPLLFRAPHGYTTALSLKLIDTYFIKWSFDTYDWKHEDAGYVYNEIIAGAEDGAIILLHDTKKTTVEGAIEAIKALKEQGVEFVRVDELLCRNGEGIKAGTPYRKCEYGKRALSF